MLRYLFKWKLKNVFIFSLRFKCKLVLSPHPHHPDLHPEHPCHRRSDPRSLPEEEAPQAAARYFYRGERDGGDEQHRWRESSRQAHHRQGWETRVSTKGICWYVLWCHPLFSDDDNVCYLQCEWNNIHFVFQMRKECVMFQSGLDPPSLFCGTTGTPGKQLTTTFRDTATSGLKVSHSVLYTANENEWQLHFLPNTNCFFHRGEEGQLTGHG